MKIITIKTDFSEYPGLRHCNISDKSGEEFYHKVLNEAFKEAYSIENKLSINLDGTDGYASSFLDEAFGNLVYDFTLKVVKKYLAIISMEEPHWEEMIKTKTFTEWEKRRVSGLYPVVTKKHKEWYRLMDNKLESKIWVNPQDEK